MLKKIAAGMFMTALATAGVIAWRGGMTQAQNDRADRVSRVRGADDLGNDQVQNLKPALKLPITQVVLFNSGVGYFHRSGEVEGDARVDLQFSAGDINDLIKSLVINDSRGKVLPLRYDSQEPIEKTLKSFAIDLSSNPSYGQILNQMRGQKVEVTIQTNNPALTGLPGTITGTIVGMETSVRPLGSSSTSAIEMELLNLSCAEGLRNVPISAIQRVRFLNPVVENELRRALDVVAIGHDSQKRTVHLGFKGEQKREVKVGYVVENPIWKTSYRLVSDEKGKWRMLAWANVENTSDDDWNDIKLTLVSSRPISFKMDLYPPLFIPRPVVEPALFASLRPPTYAGPITNAAVVMPGFGMQGGAGFQGGQFQGFNNFGQNGVANTIQQGMNPMFNNPGFGQFGQGGQFGQMGNSINPNYFGNLNRYQNEKAQLIDNSRLTFEQMQGRRNADNNNLKNNEQRTKQVAQQLGSALTQVNPELLERALAAEELGHPARHTIEQKVSLPRQQSVMLPIMDEPIDAAKVSIFNQSVHASRPLHGLRIKNKSKQALMSGPVTIYEGEQPYSGDARLADMQPGEERYVSFAVDTGVEIKPYDRVEPGPEMNARLDGGRLSIQYKLRQTRTYAIVNRSPDARKVVIEQPIRAGWKLVAPEKPLETTADLYRFEVDVKAGETIKYDVSEELPRIDPFEVTKQTDWSGFATSIGLDVWSEIKRTPEDSCHLQVADNGKVLQVTHQDRRGHTVFFRNRADVDRTVWLEHAVPTDRRLLGDHPPIDKSTNRYRFKLELKKGTTGSVTFSDERVNRLPENFPLQTLAGYNTARPTEDDGPANRFVTELGFELWQVRTVTPESIVKGRFVKGELQTTAREVETVTYHIRNRSGEQRSYIVDHLIRPNWKIGDGQAGVTTTERCAQFTVSCPPGRNGKHAVAEERLIPKKELIAEITPERFKTLVESNGIAPAVRDAIKKAMELRITFETTQAQLKELRSELREINEEQGRLRTNLEKLPPTSELYKRYLSKLDQAETTLEKIQSKIVAESTKERTQKSELDGYLSKLNLE